MLKKRKNILLELFVCAFLIYVGVIFLFWLNQRSFVYFPNPQRQLASVYNASDMGVVKVPTEDGLELEGWYKAPQAGKPVIVVFHGNASHSGLSAWKTRPYIDAGYGALLPSYRGYAGNPGKPTEQGLYTDARSFIGWLIEKQGIPENNIVLYGESLGTGIAVEMAAGAYKQVKAVILESPYTSFVDLAKHHYFFVPFGGLLVRDKYKSIDKISEVTAPLLVIGGRRDRIVPFAQGEKLFAAANEPKQMVVLDAAGHNDLYNHGAAQRVLHFLSGL